MAHTFTEDDEGKTVVNDQDEEVGLIMTVEHGTAHVEPDPGLTDSIKSALGWGDNDEDTYPLQEASVESVTDDEVRLSSSSPGGDDTASTGATDDTAGTTGTADTTGTTDDTVVGDDPDRRDNDDGLLDDDDSDRRDDDDGLLDDNDDTRQ